MAEQKNGKTASLTAAWLMIGYIVGCIGVQVYNFIQTLTNPDDWYLPGFNITAIIYLIPFMLFVVYLLFLYRRNHHNVLMPIAFTLSALLVLPSVLSSAEKIYTIVFITGFNNLTVGGDGWTRIYFYSGINGVYTLFSSVAVLLTFVAYVLFAVDGFCKFRLRKVSRITVLVLLGVSLLQTLIKLLMVMELFGETGWRFSPHPLVSMVVNLLLYGSLLVFFFGAAQKDDRIRLTPCHATVSTRMSDSYMPPIASTPARYCGHCGSPVQGDLCPNCGAQD